MKNQKFSFPGQGFRIWLLSVLITTPISFGLGHYWNRPLNRDQPDTGDPPVRPEVVTNLGEADPKIAVTVNPIHSGETDDAGDVESIGKQAIASGRFILDSRTWPHFEISALDESEDGATIGLSDEIVSFLDITPNERESVERQLKEAVDWLREQSKAHVRTVPYKGYNKSGGTAFLIPQLADPEELEESFSDSLRQVLGESRSAFLGEKLFPQADKSTALRGFGRYRLNVSFDESGSGSDKKPSFRYRETIGDPETGKIIHMVGRSSSGIPANYKYLFVIE